MTFASRSRPAPSASAERINAWGFVVAIHVLLVWVVTRPSTVVDRISSPMKLVYVELMPPPLKVIRPIDTLPVSPAHPSATRAVQRDEAVSDHGTAVHPDAPTLQATTADDRWETPARTGKVDLVGLDTNNPLHRFNPIQMGPRERFRMRGQMSPADIVRLVSMNLFWPPGYTDDPCGGLEKAVQTLSDASTARERKFLEDAVAQQQRYCM